MAITSGITGKGASEVADVAAREITREATGGTAWLTYADLAERLGIKPESAKRRAIERRWPKRLGNDGRSLVAVPMEILETTRETTGEAIGEIAGEIVGDIASEIPSDTSALVDHLKEELEAARRDLKAMTAEALNAREREGRTAAATEGLRQALDGVRQELQTAQVELRAQAAELMAAREKAARAEGEITGLRGRPWWRRLLDAG